MMNQIKKEELEITISDSDRIECAIRHIKTAVDVDPWAVEIAVEAMEKEISALQAQDSPKPKAESVQNVQNEDLISRKAAIDVLATMQGLCTSKAALVQNSKIWQQIKDLPSAQPEREKGEWTKDCACEICGFKPWYERDVHTLSFCPNCGADLRGD